VNHRQIILASQSPYRKQLFERLGYPFLAQAPLVDEENLKSQVSQDKPEKIAQFLSQQKAQSLIHQYPEAIIIGSDQLLYYGNKTYGKPHTFEVAFETLKHLQGQTHRLITAMTILTAKLGDHKNKNINLNLQNGHSWVVEAKLKMRPLSDEEIIEYINHDLPMDCAGSYKLEKRGITLFESIDCEDWTSIEGLALISVSKWLNHFLMS